MKVIRPLTSHVYQVGQRRIFLAGSIEMGAAEEWQTKVEKALARWDGYLLNPRRLDWDSSWEQDVRNDQFRQQVEWELDGLSLAHLVLLYFDPATKSPISLMELGLMAAQHKLFVACPVGFWKRGNVQVVCERFNIPLGDSLDWLIRSAMMWLNTGSAT